MKSQKGAAARKASGRGRGPAPRPGSAAELFKDFQPAQSSQEKYGVKFLFDCEICGARMIEHHCKVLCPGCGYIRDCSDP